MPVVASSKDDPEHSHHCQILIIETYRVFLKKSYMVNITVEKHHSNLRLIVKQILTVYINNC